MEIFVNTPVGDEGMALPTARAATARGPAAEESGSGRQVGMWVLQLLRTQKTCLNHGAQVAEDRVRRVMRARAGPSLVSASSSGLLSLGPDD